jgi:hypothetical protein
MPSNLDIEESKTGLAASMAGIIPASAELPLSTPGAGGGVVAVSSPQPVTATIAKPIRIRVVFT